MVRTLPSAERLSITLSAASCADGIKKILHLDRIAVVELDALAQRKRIAQAVVRLHDLRRDCRNDFTVRVGLYQPLIDIKKYFLGSCRRHIIGVKTVKILGNADADFIGGCPGVLTGYRRFRGFGGRLGGGCSARRSCRAAAASGKKRHRHHQYK